MRDQSRLLDAQGFEKSTRVSRKLLEGVLVCLRLRRLAEADLINRDYSIASILENIDGRFPCRGTKVLPVHQDDDLAVERLRFHVHVGHVHFLLLGRELELMHGVGIIVALQFRPIRGLVDRTCRGILRSHRVQNGDGQEQKHSNEKSRHSIISK